MLVNPKTSRQMHQQSAESHNWDTSRQPLFAQSVGCTQEKIDCLISTITGGINLSMILKSYTDVLNDHGIVPEEDTHFYRMVLKLSLDPSSNWKQKLIREKALHFP